LTPRYLQHETAHRDRWTISYLDVVTILLIFFVAAAAKTINVPDVTPAPKAPVDVTPAPKAPVEVTTPKSPELREVEQALQKSGLDVHREPRGLVISLPQAILFAPGDDRIAESALPTIDLIANVLAPIPNRVVLVGHADSMPIHNQRFRNNWELSAARGVRLLELLSTSYGIEESRLSVSSEGANRPRGSNDTPDGRASNRRVEMVILANFSDVASAESDR
jgi:chemotaxis protein MotB